MDPLTPAQLAQLVAPPLADAWTAPINATLAEFGLNTPARAAMFLAQVLHESAMLTHLEENLHYHGDTLLKVFPSHFKGQADAGAIAAAGPQAVANRIYASRMGNGDEASGDGWHYRGRGLIQLTGRDNYSAAAKALALDLIATPDQLADATAAARSAGWFWREHGCNALADAGNLEGVTRAINGGVIGLADRQALLARVQAVLGCAG